MYIHWKMINDNYNKEWESKNLLLIGQVSSWTNITRDVMKWITGYLRMCKDEELKDSIKSKWS